MGQSESLPVKINEDGTDQLEVKGYQVHRGRCALACLVVLLTFGLLLVLLVWRKDIKMWMFYEECPLQHASKILVKDSFGVFYEEDAQEERCGPILQPKTRFFVNKKVKYVWNIETLEFTRLQCYDANIECQSFHENPDGLNMQNVNERQQKYGANFIRITVRPVYRLILKEISNPFYLFQFYTIVVWMAQAYYDYSCLVLATTMIAVGSSVYESRKHMVALKKKVQVAGSAIVIRDGEEKRILTQQLVPGDILCINPLDDKVPFHCDAVLIEGTCSVDESMLTGESYPITKMPVPEDHEIFEYEVHKRHILFNGTQLLQGRPEGNNVFLKAVVIRTGFMTSKGELIRAILFPKPIHFRFYADLIQVAILFLGNTKEIILHSLDIVTFVVPPMLPAALTATTAFAQRRLRDKKIFCLSAKHISLSGGVDVACFDKTGTLTETDIDLAGAIPIQEGEFRKPVPQLSTLPETHPLLQAAATCHTLIKVNDQLNGYSIDRKMFDATKWNFVNGPPGVNSDYGVETPFLVSSPLWNDKRESSFNPTVEYGLLKRFPFESAIKRMTVIVQRKGHEHYNVFIKGAPEIIAELCDPVTVPSNYYSVLKHYTMQGYRVIALAVKTLSPHFTWSHIQHMTRDEVEANPELIGLLVMRNQLKKETIPAIRILHEAHIRTVMVTGDNLQTAVTVAKDCDMIDRVQRVIQVEATIVPASIHGAQHLQVLYNDPLATPEFIAGTMKKMQDVHNGNYCFAMDGQSFELLRIHDAALLDKCIHRGKVFARMAPEHKQHLIEALQKIGRQVAMVGDGCNDCSALRTADAGISLSMADASVAAPFTSQETNISCVAPLICEGRTTLDAAFGTFQFAIGICFIFFVGVLMLYSISTTPSDFQYFIWDFGIAIVPFFTIGYASPPKYLHPRRPLRHLWAFLPLFSFFTFLAWQTIVLLIGWFYCHAQPWFEPYVFEPGKHPPNPSYEETTLFNLMSIGSIVAAFVFAPSPPYSRSSFSNKIFMIWAFGATILLLCVMFITNDGFVYWMNFKTPPHPEYTVVILVLGLAGGLFSFCWEKYLIRGWMYQWVWPRLNRLRPARHTYQKIEKELKSKPDWPKLGGKDISKDLEQEPLQVEPPTPNEKRAGNSMSGEDQIPLSSPGRNSLRDLVGRGKTTFRTFQGSRRGGYTINGPKLEQDYPHESIPLKVSVTNVEVPPPVPRSPLPKTTDEESEFEFPPPPPSIPDEFMSAQSSPVQVLAIRPFEDEERNVAPPPFDIDVEQRSPLSRRGQGMFQLVDEKNVEQPDSDVQLLAYRVSRRPSDLSPSQQRRHLNGHGPHPTE
ncbi:hypothetical protein GHT06_019648 [Daphnia sinensis]|uniref:Cation-transporting ATPase n=1 Tax=Daphnia sinensis TaxID=1820382 RepID=A0AAD5KKD7_9CRUS|nr:hypothetical protein GHT06_019648 [Daphnia sinensis]